MKIQKTNYKNVKKKLKNEMKNFRKKTMNFKNIQIKSMKCFKYSNSYNHKMNYLFRKLII